MNIFVTDRCPQKSAQDLDNKRVNKMILESVQMLSTALSFYEAPLRYLPVTQRGTPYRPTHKNHPCSVWARETRMNYIWLVDHADALNEEFKKAYKKTHWIEQFMTRVREGSMFIPEGGITAFADCSLFKDGGDVTQNYRLTMKQKWATDTRTPCWKNRTKPDWV